MKHGTIALAGNPNTGKSTVFNALTGARQHVGNWPGKTVAKKTGTWHHAGRSYDVVDLPGTYSLSAFSLEEVIARNYLVEERPDVVVVVLDASNIERNLYLATQILEMRAEVVVVLNMADDAARRGIVIDTEALARRLGVPIVATTASKGHGIADLKTVIAEARAASGSRPPAIVVDYGAEMEAEIAALSSLVEAHRQLSALQRPRWWALKLLERDAEVTATVAGLADTEAILDGAARAAAALEVDLEDDVETAMADARYRWIHDLVQETVRQPAIDQITLSDRIDAVVTHRFLGIPIFLFAMWTVFKLTTDVSAPYLDWIATVIEGPVTRWTIGLSAAVGLGDTWVEGLLVDGIVAGVGGVLVFVPVLMSLYLALALLEDSGYMARAAFVMDRLMRGFGLHGRSFLPMLVGFGCTVPAIYATRTLRDERDRILTGLLVPFMSCGARLPVYVLFAAVFFPRFGGTIVFAMYLVGIVTAVLLGVVLKRSLFRAAERAPFVMELPPYRVPTIRGVATHMWSRTSGFVRKAWTIILFMSVLLWLLMAIPARAHEPGGALGGIGATPVDDSLFARTSEAISPLFSPLGFDSWESTGALLTGLIAKEVVVSTMAQVYGADLSDAPGDEPSPTVLQDLRGIATGFVQATVDTIKSVPLVVGIDLFGGQAVDEPSDLMGAIHADFRRSSGGYPALAGLAFMVFVLLYTPCMVAIAAARHEFGAKWMWTSVIGQFAIAWTIAFAVFQGGRLLAG